MFTTSSARVCLFLQVRTHSQLQYYLNLHNTRRAANEGRWEAKQAPPFGKVVQLHAAGRRHLCRHPAARL
jgi:hypothetical protein